MRKRLVMRIASFALAAAALVRVDAARADSPGREDGFELHVGVRTPHFL